MPPNLPPTFYNSMQANVGIPQMGVQAPSPGQVAAALQQQAQQMQYAMPRPPQLQGGMAFGHMSASPLMGQAAQARQHAVGSYNSLYGGIQAGVGTGARLLGGIGATMLGGPLGGMAFEALGGGQALQNLATMPLQPFMQDRERSLSLQSASTRFMQGGGAMSSAGAGMSMASAQQVTSGLNRMSSDRGFQASTGGMFNRSDLDRITRLSGELGMLDNAGTADQITREVKKVSKALSNFMKLAEEPDIQRAMQQMARMRNLGFSMPEISTATANARTFARMAGVTVSQAMEGAERGSAAYQRMGLTGAAGFNAGLGAQGYARQAATLLSPQQLALAGGQGGMEQMLIEASGRALTNGSLTPSLVNFRGGSASVDPRAIQRMISGGFGTLGSQVQQGAANMRGAGVAGVNDMIARAPELQDSIARQLGPQGLMMLPALQAMQTMRQTRGNVSFGNALSMSTGLDPTQTAHMERMFRDPAFMQNIRRQMEISQRESTVSSRNAINERMSLRNRVGRGLEDTAFLAPLPGLTIRRGRDFLDTQVFNPISEHFADEQDREEALEQHGDGPARVIRRNRYGSSELDAATRSFSRRARGRDSSRVGAIFSRARAAGMSEDAREADIDRRRAANIQMGNAPGIIAGMVEDHFVGPHGFGLDRTARGGDSTRDVLYGNMSVGQRVQAAMFGGPSAQEARWTLQGQADLARTIDESSMGNSVDRSRGVSQRLSSAFLRGSNATQGQAGARSDRATAIATEAVRNFVSNAEGLRIGGQTQAALQGSVRTALTRAGFSAAEANAALGDSAFLTNAVGNARGSMGEEQRNVLDTIASRGRDAAGAIQAQGIDRVREQGVAARSKAVYNLGLKGRGESANRIVSLLGSTDNAAKDELKRKLLTAYMMARSSNPEARERGTAEVERLKRSSDPEMVREVDAAVQATLSGMSDEDKDALAQQVQRRGGGNVDSANRFMERVSRDVETSQHGARAEGMTRTLGSAEAAEAYNAGGGGAAGVRALRQNPSLVSDRRLREKLSDGTTSDEEIAAEIERRTTSSGSTQGSADARGAVASEADQEATATTEEMMNTIAAGMEEFPDAVTQLSEAAAKLSDTADRLADAAGLARVTGNLEAGSGNSGGFFSNLFGS